MDFKLGRLKKPHDDRDLMGARYLGSVPEPPASVDYSHKVKHWGDLGNSTVGCCTISGMGHQVQSWTANAQGREASVTVPQVIKRYERLSGYIPGDDSTDTGLVERDVLKDWLTTPLGSHKLAAFASLAVPERSSSITDITHFKQGLHLFGGLYLGLDLPLTARDQMNAHQPWDYVSGTRDSVAGSWGGHCVYACGYNDEGVTVVTWGSVVLCTWLFIRAYCSEAWMLISETDWLKAGKTPNGFDLATLQADLAALKAA